jgi:hypothetical protein
VPITSQSCPARRTLPGVPRQRPWEANTVSQLEAYEHRLVCVCVCSCACAPTNSTQYRTAYALCSVFVLYSCAGFPSEPQAAWCCSFSSCYLLSNAQANDNPAFKRIGSVDRLSCYSQIASASYVDVPSGDGADRRLGTWEALAIAAAAVVAVAVAALASWTLVSWRRRAQLGPVTPNSWWHTMSLRSLFHGSSDRDTVDNTWLSSAPPLEDKESSSSCDGGLEWKEHDGRRPVQQSSPLTAMTHTPLATLVPLAARDALSGSVRASGMAVSRARERPQASAKVKVPAAAPGHGSGHIRCGTTLQLPVKPPLAPCSALPAEASFPDGCMPQLPTGEGATANRQLRRAIASIAAHRLLFAERYVLTPGCIEGRRSVVHFAREKDSNVLVAIKCGH